MIPTSDQDMPGLPTSGTNEAEFFLDNLAAPDELGSFSGTIALNADGNLEVYTRRTGDDALSCVMTINWLGHTTETAWEKDSGTVSNARARQTEAVILYRRGWTQVEIAKQLGVAQKTVSRYLAQLSLSAPEIAAEEPGAIDMGRRQRRRGGGRPRGRLTTLDAEDQSGNRATSVV